jgi:GTPase
MGRNKEQKQKAGFVVLLGRANVGKSTLLNNLLGKKVSIISKVPQTTRFTIRGILNDERGQIIFVDTPGIYLSKEKLSKFLTSHTLAAKEDADLILYMVDLSKSPAREENEIMSKLYETNKPVIMALNKRDLGQFHADQYIELWKTYTKERKEDPLKYFIPISALQMKGLDKLIDALFEFLPISGPLYPKDIASDLPEKLLIADIVREKIFNLTREEVPHSVAVKTETIEERDSRLIYIQATILVKRDSQKAIIIGKNGQFLKEIGKQAREELELNYRKKVFLDLWIKVKKNWEEDVLTLRELGYLA